MARTARRSTREELANARRALGMSQKRFGYAIGASHRTAARWDAGQATPAYHHLRQLAVLLHRHDRCSPLARATAQVDEGASVART
jgi:DNA-binding transcriptional regulator YiaG